MFEIALTKGVCLATLYSRLRDDGPCPEAVRCSLEVTIAFKKGKTFAMPGRITKRNKNAVQLMNNGLRRDISADDPR